MKSVKSAFVKTTLLHVNMENTKTLKYIIYVFLIAFVTLFLVMSCEPQQEPSYITYQT